MPEDQLLAELIAKAIQPLQDRISTLESMIVHQEERIAALEASQVTLSDNQLIQLQLIKQLREAAKRETQPMQKDRAEILRALLAANGGKMLAKEARQKMHLSKQAFSNLLATMKDEIHSRPYHLDRRQVILALK